MCTLQQGAAKRVPARAASRASSLFSLLSSSSSLARRYFSLSSNLAISTAWPDALARSAAACAAFSSSCRFAISSATCCRSRCRSMGSCEARPASPNPNPNAYPARWGGPLRKKSAARAVGTLAPRFARPKLPHRRPGRTDVAPHLRAVAKEAQVVQRRSHVGCSAATRTAAKAAPRHQRTAPRGGNESAA